MALAVLCADFVYIKSNLQKSDGAEKFKSVPSSIMLCNFGSSHGRDGFNYADTAEKNCFNFAMSSQTLSYDRRLLDYYKKNIEKGAIVFMPVSYFSLYGKDEQEADNFKQKNKRYYKILPVGMIKDYDIKTAIYVRFPSLSAGGESLMRAVLGLGKDTDGQEKLTKAKNVADIDLTEYANEAFQRHFVDRLDENGNIIVNQEEVDSLKYMINTCKEIGAIPIVVTTPYLQEYTDEFKENCPEFLEEFYALVKEIAKETGVEYYDYAFDERFIHNYAWFNNGDHLNEEGGRQFTNILMKEVFD